MVEPKIKLIHSNQISTDVYLSLLYLNEYYPNFSNWYVNQFSKSVLNGEGSLILAKDNMGKLAGCALLKNTEEEKKIRCLRVDPAYSGSGLGIRLIDKSIELLEFEKPNVTVCEEMFHHYSRPFINRYGFNIERVSKGLYRPKKFEYHFNHGVP